jgi:hypothetical protein
MSIKRFSGYRFIAVAEYVLWLSMLSTTIWCYVHVSVSSSLSIVKRVVPYGHQGPSEKEYPSPIGKYYYLSYIVDETQNTYQTERNYDITGHMGQVTARPRNQNAETPASTVENGDHLTRIRGTSQ